MPPIPTQGWLPIEFEFDAEPAVITNASATWMQFGERPLAEPFFRHTVTELQEIRPPVPQVDTSIDALLRMGSLLPPVRPAGFIFHISHCGSTLISNALKTAPQTVVASESLPFIRLASWYPECCQTYLRERWAGTRRALFEALFRLYAHYRTGEPEQLVIKFASMNLFGMKFVRENFPDVPCILVVRDPIAVVMSALREPGWLAHKQEPERLATFYAWTDPPRPFAEMSDEEYCARMLGRHLDAAIDAVGDTCKVIDYEDLNARGMRNVAEFFGLELPSQPDELEKVLHTYSKDPGGAIPFRADSVRKRAAAPRAVVAAAKEWAMPGYIDLRGRGAW